MKPLPDIYREAVKLVDTVPYKNLDQMNHWEGEKFESNRRQPIDEAVGLVLECADESVDWLCDHVGAHPTAGERKWCSQCSNWVYPKDKESRDRLRISIEKLRAILGERGG